MFVAAFGRGDTAWRRAARALPICALAGCGWLFWQTVDKVDAAALANAFIALSPAAVMLAVLAACGGFWALGRFEAALRPVIGLAGEGRIVHRSGMAAAALAQTLGFGVATGAFSRWRAEPDLGAGRAAQAALAAAIAFTLALGLAAVLAGLWRLHDWALFLGIGALALAIASRVAPSPRLPGLTPVAVGRLALWAAADLTAGALILALLLPPEALPPLPIYVTAYLWALTAGIVSQSPGGLGAFEATLIALLPGAPLPDLLAALAGYRVIYHVGPAVLALLWLLPRRPAARVDLHPLTGAPLTRVLARAPRPDWALARQGATVLAARDRAGAWLTRPAGRWLVALGRPLGMPGLDGLMATARAQQQQPFLYKADPRTAAEARAAGWRVLRIAEEAVLTPATWTADRPACRSLRRKLRAAAASGLVVTAAGPDLPRAQMAIVSALWAGAKGGEMGFSMAGFSPAALTDSAVFLAWHGPRLVGFVSFQRSRRDWSLDLVRWTPDAPDGTMASLVTAAITMAARAGVDRVSLAAVPAPPPGLPPWLTRVLSRPGLRQFKAAFGPRWQPLYAAAPGRLALIGGLIAVRRAIMVATKDAGSNTIHADHAENRFEQAARPCDAPKDESGQPDTGFGPQQGHLHDQRPVPPFGNP